MEFFGGIGTPGSGKVEIEHPEIRAATTIPVEFLDRLSVGGGSDNIEVFSESFVESIQLRWVVVDKADSSLIAMRHVQPSIYGLVLRILHRPTLGRLIYYGNTTFMLQLCSKIKTLGKSRQTIEIEKTRKGIRPMKLLDPVRDVIGKKRYPSRTEQACVA